MNFYSKLSAMLVVASGLCACAGDSEPMMNDGIVESAPIGSNVRPTATSYRRGGSSSSVKVLSRENLEEEGATADDVLKPE